MKLEELEKKYEELGKEIEALKAEDKPWPQVGDNYYIPSTHSAIPQRTWMNDITDHEIFELGNCYSTKEEVELYNKRRRVNKKLRDLAGGYKWRYMFENYSVYWNYAVKEWRITIYKIMFHPNTTYFESAEAAQHAIDTLGSELDVLREVCDG